MMLSNWTALLLQTLLAFLVVLFSLLLIRQDLPCMYTVDQCVHNPNFQIAEIGDLPKRIWRLLRTTITFLEELQDWSGRVT